MKVQNGLIAIFLVRCVPACAVCGHREGEYNGERGKSETCLHARLLEICKKIKIHISDNKENLLAC